MSHFKYEIDERNIRLQLKAFEMPFSEDAWHKFESYSLSHNLAAASTPAARFKFALNRNVVLPVVFGSVIISFSLLLFNFVNIKNPGPAGAARAESVQQQAAAQQQPAAEKKEAEVASARAEQEPAVTVAAQAAGAGTAQSAPEEHTARPETTPEHKIVITPVKDTSSEPEAAAERAVAGTETKSTDSAATETARSENRTKKKSKKRSAVILEPAEGEDEQAPPPVSEASAE